MNEQNAAIARRVSKIIQEYSEDLLLNTIDGEGTNRTIERIKGHMSSLKLAVLGALSDLIDDAGAPQDILPLEIHLGTGRIGICKFSDESGSHGIVFIDTGVDDPSRIGSWVLNSEDDNHTPQPN